MSATQEKYEVTVYLINGTKLQMWGGASKIEIQAVYRCLGADDSRIKFPTAVDVAQFLPASSVLRIEAKGDWSE